MATVTWVVLKHHKKVDGTYNPKIRITHNRTTAYLQTQIFTPLVRFKKGESTGCVTDGEILDSLNDKVKEIRKIINRYDHVIEDSEDAKAVLSFVNRKMHQVKEIDFLDFASSHLNALKENGSKTVKACLLSNLRKFVDAESLPINKLTSIFLKRFETWLIKRNVANSSISVYMQVFQSIYNKALLHYNDYEIGDILIVGNPFKSYRFEKVSNQVKKAVPASTIRQIINYTPKKQGQKGSGFARDMFLLSFCLAGMNIVDIFSCSDYTDGRINYYRQKTREKKKNRAFISVPVIPEVLDIFERYRCEGNERVFNLYKGFKNIQYVRISIANGMKRMCKDLNIDPATFYAARHSFATIARNECNVGMDDIALCLTHASEYSMTDTYVRPDFSRVDEVIRKVINYVFKDKKSSF